MKSELSAAISSSLALTVRRVSAIKQGEITILSAAISSSLALTIRRVSAIKQGEITVKNIFYSERGEFHAKLFKKNENLEN